MPNLAKALFILVLAASNVAVAEFKIATVDLYKIVNESKEAREKRVHIEKLSNDAKKKFEVKKQALGALEKSSKDSEKLRTESKDLARFVHDTDEEIQKQILKTNKDLGERAAKIIEEYAKSQNIDLVLYKGSMNRGSVLYGNSAVDITDEILKRFDSAG